MSKAGTILKAGDKESRSTTVKDNIVSVHHVTKHPKAGLVVCDWTFDFTGIDIPTLQRLASRSLVIDARNAFKSIDPKMVGANATQALSVKKLITAQKRGKPITEKAADLIKSMTPEQIAEALKAAGIEQ